MDFDITNIYKSYDFIRNYLANKMIGLPILEAY